MFTRVRHRPAVADPLTPFLLPGEALTASQSAYAQTAVSRIQSRTGDITAKGARLIAEKSPKQARLWTLIADHLAETGAPRVSELCDRRLVDFVAADINPVLAKIPTHPSSATLAVRHQLFRPLARPPFTEFQRQYRQQVLAVYGAKSAAELKAESEDARLSITRSLWLCRVAVHLDLSGYPSLDAVPAGEYFRFAYEYLPTPAGPRVREFAAR